MQSAWQWQGNNAVTSKGVWINGIHAGEPFSRTCNTVSTFRNRLIWFRMHGVPCQKHSACIYLLQLAYVMSQNEIKAQKWFSKSHAPAHQARATAGKASLQARADFQQQDCVGEDSLCLLQHLNSSCNCNKQKRQLHCLV